MRKAIASPKAGLDGMKIGLNKDEEVVTGIYQLFFIECPPNKPFALSIVYSNSGKVNTDHFPKEDIIYIEWELIH